MPGTTANRNYNYPLPADATNTAGDIQRLAGQVDADVNILDHITRPRPMAQFLGDVANIIPGTSTSGLLTWQLTDYNTRPPIFPFGDLQDDITAVVPVTGVNTTQLQVNYTGFWMIQAAVQLRSSQAGSGIDSVGIEFVWSGAPATVVARNYVHDVVFPTERTHILDLSWGVHMNANDTIALRGVVGRSSLTNSVTFENRSITMLRMTET